MKVPKDFQDYDDNDPEIEFRRKRDKFWQALRELRRNFSDDLNVLAHREEFLKHVEDTCGIRIKLQNDYFTDTYDVIDEKLYAFFLLKYM